MHKSRTAFTLIEVMVAVMIVSVVIAALLQMRGNTTNKFFNLKKMIQTSQYNSFLLANDNKYGLEKSNIDMQRLADGFDLQSDLRRKLKAIKLKLDYKVTKTIDTSELDDGSGSTSSSIVFEIGKTSLHTEDFSSSLTRIRLR